MILWKLIFTFVFCCNFLRELSGNSATHISSDQFDLALKLHLGLEFRAAQKFLRNSLAVIFWKQSQNSPNFIPKCPFGTNKACMYVYNSLESLNSNLFIQSPSYFFTTWPNFFPTTFKIVMDHFRVFCKVLSQISLHPARIGVSFSRTYQFLQLPTPSLNFSCAFEVVRSLPAPLEINMR